MNEQVAVVADSLATSRPRRMVLVSLGIALATSLTLSQSHAQSGNRQKKLEGYFGDRTETRRPAGKQQHGNAIFALFFRTNNGSLNNLFYWSFGKAGVALRREAPAAYGDGISTPARANLLSAREISNIVVAQDESIPNQAGLTSMVWQWGQFLDHDLDLTEPAIPAEEFFIDVPSGDFYFDPLALGDQEIEFFRSEHETEQVRQQINIITSWIDGSSVYGSDDETARSLRTLSSGMMRESEGGLLPIDDEGFFVAGDIRANEQIGLTAMHTLFVREHNRIAQDLANRYPWLGDELTYLLARRKVVGIIQSITYNEFLPALLGDGSLAPYGGYNPAVSPDISNEFATAAYRFGHSMLNAQLLRLNNDSSVAAEGNIALRDSFFNPAEISQHGIDSLLKGLTVQQAQEIDAGVIDDVRNFLFGAPGAGGFDLPALNMQRGRDHGLPDLNSIRTSIGLSPHSSIDTVTSDADLRLDLSEAYPTVDDIDPWVGMLSEDHVPGSNLGETAHRIVVSQFERLRDADRFWYQRYFRGRSLEEIEDTRLSDVIMRNTSVKDLQPNVFTLNGAIESSNAIDTRGPAAISR